MRYRYVAVPQAQVTVFRGRVGVFWSSPFDPLVKSNVFDTLKKAMLDGQEGRGRCVCGGGGGGGCVHEIPVI
jgi:hypothetical protein